MTHSADSDSAPARQPGTGSQTESLNQLLVRSGPSLGQPPPAHRRPPGRRGPGSGVEDAGAQQGRGREDDAGGGGDERAQHGAQVEPARAGPGLPRGRARVARARRLPGGGAAAGGAASRRTHKHAHTGQRQRCCRPADAAGRPWRDSEPAGASRESGYTTTRLHEDTTTRLRHEYDTP
jgi:hypothetical protein